VGGRLKSLLSICSGRARLRLVFLVVLALAASNLGFFLSVESALAGPNASGVAWLSWSPVATPPSGQNSWTSNISSTGEFATLYVHFLIPTGVVAVGSEVAFCSVGDVQLLSLTDASEASGASCGYVTNEPRLDSLAFGQVFPTSIHLADPAQRCFSIKFHVDGIDTIAAEFRLAKFWVQDSQGAVDSLTIVGNATIRLGLGTVSPGLLIENYGSAPMALAASQRKLSPSRSHAAQYDFMLSTQHGTEVTAVALKRGQLSFPAQVTSSDTAAGVTHCRIPTQGLSTGPYDVAYSTLDGGSVQLPSALRLAERPAYLDTLAVPVDSLAIPFAAMSCPTRVVGWPSSGPVGGGLYSDGYCHLYAPGNYAYCDQSVYPSFYDNTAPGGVTILTKSAMYKILGCDDNPIPNRDIAVEVRRASSSACHCHENGPVEVGSAIRDPDPNHHAGTDITCVALPDGGYRCTGNTGPSGESFIILHKWPKSAAVLNVLMYETSTGGAFYNAVDTVFHFCTSQATAMVDRLVDLPDTLELVGGMQKHSHGGVPPFLGPSAMTGCPV